MKNFVKQFTAHLVGDDSTIQAEKAFRQADSAIKTQLASLRGDVVIKEDTVTEAVEAQSLSRINYGLPIKDRNEYTENLIKVKNKVTIAEESLKAHNLLISFFEAELQLLT